MTGFAVQRRPHDRGINEAPIPGHALVGERLTSRRLHGYGQDFRLFQVAAGLALPFAVFFTDIAPNWVANDPANTHPTLL